MTKPNQRTRISLLDRLKIRWGSRISDESYLYGRILPGVILFMGLVMVALIVVALAVLAGIVR